MGHSYPEQVRECLMVPFDLRRLGAAPPCESPARALVRTEVSDGAAALTVRPGGVERERRLTTVRPRHAAVVRSGNAGPEAARQWTLSLTPVSSCGREWASHLSVWCQELARRK